MSSRSQTQRDTSWQKVSKWYNRSVGSQGHYYHQHVVLPNALRLLDLHKGDSLVDLGCGQGVLARRCNVTKYLGLDAAKDLVAAAQKQEQRVNYRYIVQDVTKQHQPHDTGFSHGAMILSLQNMADGDAAVANAAAYLQKGAKLIMVINHPCYRIPRQSGWGIDERTKQQYRWINRYLSPLEIPIEMQPGQRNSRTTLSFHRPLSSYFHSLKSCGFVVLDLEEWTSDKQSEGSAAKMENRARSEFPLFMAILAQKYSRDIREIM